MTFVREVISDSNFGTSILGLFSMLSANTILAPCLTKANAEETKVYDGTITSSPGITLHRIAAISKASVQEVVIKHFFIFQRSSK